MNIFSLSHILELAKELPDPQEAEKSGHGFNRVLRLPLRDWDAVLDQEHPERKFDAHANAFVEFELLQWRNTQGLSSPRWVLRGLVAI